jgi:diguanylate cyclase (GGDEF)-like protein
METLGITRKIVGQPKLSQCWIGAPLIASGHTIGILVAASYKQHAFDSEDLNLLEDIANLTAMALDNSSHHATVKHQSQMDSLTNTLNHGSFITELDKAITLAQKDRHPLSVIMLDIDGFKAYNDQYGHLVGDEVLIVLAETIALDIKSTDFIGRWGGEEFAIALPHTNREQAHIAAERVRTSVKDLKLFDREGNNIQPPTVCQGIAFFPDEAGDSFNLIDVADQRLYVAKKRGRDQIESDEHTLTKNN